MRSAVGGAGFSDKLLAIVTVPHYANLLSVLSWFMDGNDVRHLVEANRTSNAPGLREAFRVHGQEESGHYKYALRDLAALGFVRTPTPPDEKVLQSC